MVQYGYSVLLLACMVISTLHTVGSILLIIVLFGFEYSVPALPGLIVNIEALTSHGLAEGAQNVEATEEPAQETRA